MVKDRFGDNSECFADAGTEEAAGRQEHLNEWQCCLDNINASVIVSDYSTHK